jgi:DNA polymerase I-like protein with 3'-5' exonuclease and polymerase domains
MPRFSKELTGQVRSIYTAGPGMVLNYWDVSQAEMRLAAYLSNDPAFINACGADVHAGNAKVVFPEIAAKGWLDGEAKKDPQRGKPFRDIAKNFGFAICYGAEAERLFATLLSQGFKVTFRAIELILAKLRAAYKVYYRWAERNVEKVRECGFMRSPILGRIRWFGWFPKATEIYNFPVQSALADIMNARTIEIHNRLGGLGAANGFVSQIHDAAIVEGPIHDSQMVQDLIKEVWSRPIKGLPGGDLVLPIDQKQGHRCSEF